MVLENMLNEEEKDWIYKLNCTCLYALEGLLWDSKCTLKWLHYRAERSSGVTLDGLGSVIIEQESK
jgi:hypothetical protein